jgi:hypothetical protein
MKLLLTKLFSKKNIKKESQHFKNWINKHKPIFHHILLRNYQSKLTYVHFNKNPINSKTHNQNDTYDQKLNEIQKSI